MFQKDFLKLTIAFLKNIGLLVLCVLLSEENLTRRSVHSVHNCQ